jgi:FtsP/CotA-like multicopper oxidase with cupredoxin domain
MLMALLLGAAPEASGDIVRPTTVGAPQADTLVAPAVLENHAREPRTVEVTLTATPTRLELVPGEVADGFAYNGQVPGPTLEVTEGDRLIIHLRNELEEETTVHRRTGVPTTRSLRASRPTTTS